MATPEVIELTVSNSLGDLVRAWQAAAREYARIWRWRPSRRLVIAGAACTGLLAIALVAVMMNRPNWFASAARSWLVSLVGVSLCMLTWLCLIPLFNWFVLRRRIRKLMEMTWANPGGLPVQSFLRFGPDILEVRTPGDVTRWDKSAIYSIFETAEQIVILARSTTFPIPKRQLDAASLVSLRTSLTAWGYPPLTVQRKPLVPLWGWIALAGFFSVLNFTSLRPAFLLSAEPKSPVIAVQLASQLLRLANGPVTLSNATFELYANGTSSPRIHLGGVIRTPQLTGWVDVEADWRGFTTLTPEQDMRDSRLAIPADATIGALPDHGAIATWTRRNEDKPPQACVALRQYLEPLSPAVYRRNVFITACSPALSQEELTAWEQEVVPGLNRRLAQQQASSDRPR